MSTYKTVTNKDDIILKKKNNKFKLETKKKIRLPCNIIELAENSEIFNLFKLLNDKLINKCKTMKNNKNYDVMLFLNNILETENSDESNDNSNKNYYLSFTSNVINKDKNSITLEGKKNHKSIDKDGWKKIEIDNIIFYINLINDQLEIELTFEYIGEKMPIYAENTLGLIFRKIIKNLILYYSNTNQC